jgi:hypothetical protein
MQPARYRLWQDSLRKAPSRRLLEAVGQASGVGFTCIEGGGPAPQG